MYGYSIQWRSILLGIRVLHKDIIVENSLSFESTLLEYRRIPYPLLDNKDL